jgi:hypothetical protein
MINFAHIAYRLVQKLDDSDLLRMYKVGGELRTLETLKRKDLLTIHPMVPRLLFLGSVGLGYAAMAS